MKKSVQALSLAPDVKSWLTNSRYPRILHIFDRACNLINERGEVLSIVTPQIGDGPFNLVLENEISLLDYLNLKSRVFISPTQVILGHLIIHLENVKRWDPRPDWTKLHARRGEIGDQVSQVLTLVRDASAGVTNSLTFAGPAIALREPLELLNHQRLQIPQTLLSGLSSSFAIADTSSSLRAVQKLAGLGSGLTPAGDDYIMGALYAAWIIHPPEVAGILAQEVANTAAPLTTSLSAAWLRCAGKGQAGLLWHEFFDTLVSNDHTQIKESMENILAVGETSGTDAMAGFASMYLTWLEKAGSSHG